MQNMAARNVFRAYGWNDYLFKANGGISYETVHDAGATWELDQQSIEQWYREGWEAAERAEQDQGRVPFLLTEALKIMDVSDEATMHKIAVLTQKAIMAYAKE